MVSTRALRWLAALLALGLLAASCSSDDEPERLGAADTTTSSEPPSEFNEAQFEGEPQPGGSMTVGVRFGFSALDPAGLSEQLHSPPPSAVYDPLVSPATRRATTRPRSPPSGRLSDDLTTYTLSLREDVVFHDGAPFDAAAVVAHFERLRDPARRTARCVEDLIGYRLGRGTGFVHGRLHAHGSGPLLPLLSSRAPLASSSRRRPLPPPTPTTASTTAPPGRYRTVLARELRPLRPEEEPRLLATDDEGRSLPYLDEIEVRADRRRR